MSTSSKSQFGKPPADPLDAEGVAQVRGAMTAVLAAHPQLGANGFGDLHERACMLDAYHLAEFVAARRWLSQWKKLKQANRRGTSYGLKNVAECEVGYLCNGVFIAAAIAEGFKPTRVGDGPNAFLNIATAAWR